MSNTTLAQPAPVDQRQIVEVRDLVVKYGDVTAVNGVGFGIRAGEFLTLLGPSGCGKTTILRAIAGLERPTSGAIVIDGRAVYSSKEGIDIPAEKRNLSMVFQSYAIWPHMTVFENVVYGLRVRRRPKDEIKELQTALGVTSVYVTHDQEEALTMSDRIIVMSNGRIQQESTPAELYDYPINRFVANFIGSANLFPGAVEESTRSGRDVHFVLQNGDRVRAVDNRPSRSERNSLLAIRSVYPQLRASADDAPACNAWPAKVLRATFSGEFIEYLVETGWGEIVVRQPPTDRFAVGGEATLAIDPQHCVVIED